MMSPGDHLAAQEILAAGLQPTREDVEAEGSTLRAALKARSAAPVPV